MSNLRQSRDPEAHLWVRTHAVGYPAGLRLPAHAHGWGQLVYATEGVMTVRAQAGGWVVPSSRAVWIPPDAEHAIEMSGRVSLRSLYLVRALCRRLPSQCCVVSVSPLLRELILVAIRRGCIRRDRAEDRRFARFLLDQLELLSAEPLTLPMPRDERALCAARIIQDAPGGSASLDAVARRAGASRRTLERLFRAETGMTLGRWRQQARLLHALRLLAAKEPVTAVALAVGYESPSAFVAMFREALGTTPSRYFQS
jgi:AraC-like DNA-binding protein